MNRSFSVLVIFATWEVKPSKLEEVLLLLEELQVHSIREEGNIFYEVHQSIANANTLVLHEGYTDEAALDAHQESPHFKRIVLNRILPLLENRQVVVTHRLLN